VPYLKMARERGARVVLLDPRRSGGAAYVDQWLPVYPGTDVVVALAMIRHLVHTGRVADGFLREHCLDAAVPQAAAEPWTLERASEVSRVPARDIAALADAYSEAEPALVRVGWGLERNRNGGSAVAAILALVALAGKFGRRGGGYTLSNSEAFRVDDERLRGCAEAPTRVINMNRLGRALLGEVGDPPIQALFVYDCNPVVTVPNQNAVVQGLSREDLFTVVFDSVLTDTAPYADVLLPAVTFLEQAEVYSSYGSYGLHVTQPVVPPVGEGRPNEDVFRALAQEMGFDEPEFREDAASLRERALAAVGASLADRGGLEARGFSRLAAAEPVQFVTAFPGTPDRKMRLAPPELGPGIYAQRDEPDAPKGALALISPATDKTINSVLGELVHGEASLTMHPDDALARGVANRMPIRVFNALGEVRCLARLDERIRPGVVSLPKGLWRRSFRNGTGSTVLCPDTLNEIAGGACFNDARVEVAPAAS